MKTAIFFHFKGRGEIHPFPTPESTTVFGTSFQPSPRYQEAFFCLIQRPMVEEQVYLFWLLQNLPTFLQRYCWLVADCGMGILSFVVLACNYMQ